MAKLGGGLQVGDWLVSVNDLDVSHDNVNALLSAVTRFVHGKTCLLLYCSVEGLSSPHDNQRHVSK